MAAILVLGVIGTANAIPPKKQYLEDDGAIYTAADSNGGFDQHGPSSGHLPGQVSNVQRVGRLRVTDTTSGIADLAYFRGFAYLNAWHPECPNSGTHVVDVRDPAHPQKVAFIPAGAHDYTTEGAHAFHMNTNKFEGDVYVVSHESCDAEGLGGFSLWDISDPANPWPLTRHFGDRSLGGDAFAHDYHSAMGFNWNGKAYVIAVDNFQQGSGDIDIFDISDPGQPVHLVSTGLNQSCPPGSASYCLPTPAGMEVARGNLANGANAFHHDMWVRKFDHDGNGSTEPMMMVSYWDAGWILLDLTDPANPAFVDESNYDDPDPEASHLPGAPFTSEGNAHQGEWSQNLQYWMGSDEDFGPSRVQFVTDDGGNYSGGEFSWTVPIDTEYEDDQINGPTIWGGTGCPTDVDGDGTPDRDQIPPASDYTAAEGEELMLVMSRGSCFFSEKVESAELKGYDVGIVGNHHAGTLNGLNPDAYLCGSLGHDYEPTINGLCIGHAGMHGFFDDDSDYDDPTFTGDMPAIGLQGDTITAGSTFDGWGYLQQLNADTLEQIDTFAPAKVHDPDCADASICGIMSIHEIATDKRAGVNMGYIAWYGLGLRVVKFGPNGITQKGVYMDVGGNDFWGVEVWNRPGKRPLILMSDRDSGLWIFRYTGPE